MFYRMNKKKRMEYLSYNSFDGKRNIVSTNQSSLFQIYINIMTMKIVRKSFLFILTLKMEVSDDNNGFDDQLRSISASHKTFYDNL